MSNRYSSHERYSSRSGDSRRRSSPPRQYRSRRSPSPSTSRSHASPPPRPRDPQNLPESFGRVQEERKVEDDLNVLQRMRSSFKNSPLEVLYSCVTENQKIKLWTRNFKEVRGVMTGYVVAFDKHWNLILKDVEEVSMKRKKNKTPFLREVNANENLPDMPVKVPKVKKTAGEKAESAPAPPQPAKTSGESTGTKEKKKSKKSKVTSERRNVDQLFVRGDNIVMICPIEESEAAEEGEAASTAE